LLVLGTHQCIFLVLTIPIIQIQRYKLVVCKLIKISAIAQSVKRWARRPRNWCSILGRGKEIFLFSTSSRPALGTNQPTLQWVPRALSTGVKRPRSLSNAEVKNMWIYTITCPCVFTADCLRTGINLIPFLQGHIVACIVHDKRISLQMRPGRQNKISTSRVTESKQSHN
jgi:hypothetical protein